MTTRLLFMYVNKLHDKSTTLHLFAFEMLLKEEKQT
jgi:hypothetical protein